MIKFRFFSLFSIEFYLIDKDSLHAKFLLETKQSFLEFAYLHLKLAPIVPTVYKEIIISFKSSSFAVLSVKI